MAKFLVTAPDGAKYEISANDESSALEAFARMQSTPQVEQSTAPIDTYDQNLAAVRQSQFPDFTDQQWQEYSSKMFAPYSPMEQGQHSQLFGLTDELSAGVGALGSQVRQWTGGGGPGFGEAFGQYKALQESRRDLGQQQNGALGATTEVLGGLSAFGPGRAATFAALPSAVNLSKPAALASGTIAGALMGGAYGLGAADENRLDAGALGAGVGTVVGRFAPTVTNALASGAQNLTNRFAANQAARSVGVSPEVARMLQETMAADGTLSPAGLARMQAAGGEAMLADAGPSAKRMLDTAVQSSGRAGMVAREAIGERVSRDSQAIQDALNAALGQPEGIQTARARIASETSAPRSQAYRTAHAQPIDYSSQSGYLLDELLTRVPQSAINRANQLMQINGEKSAQILAQVAEDGTVTYLRKPDVRQIDYITRALNQEAEAGIGMGAMGGQTDIGAALGNLSENIRTVTRNHVPEYDAALNTASDAIGRSKAVVIGADILKPQTTMETVIRQTSNLSADELAALKQGIRSHFDEALARVRRTIGNSDTEAREAQRALLELSSRANRTKIAAAIGEEDAAALFAELDRAAQSFELAGAIATGSDTFGRQEMNRRIGQLTDGDGPIPSLMRGEPVNAGKRIVQALTGMTPDKILMRQDLINEEIARALTARGGNALGNMQALQSMQAGIQPNPVAQALANLTPRIGAPASTFATRRYQAGSN